MTVYVDNMRRRAQLQGRPANWSHMLADTHQELMSMADEMGLRPEWLQHPGTYREHFDVTDAKRTQAIGFGAMQIDYPHGTGRVLAAKRAALEAAEAKVPPVCECVGYTIRTDYGTGVEHGVDRSDCPIHGASEEGR